ncbi:Zn-dependent peptidase ImmA (M78 family) [Streptomyces umbrinus]|uniref:ImmA/IrrE family metallo-endopeptidase n=1 Tax=Streptomyces umbrinus TaxID=67370 RepID=UPI00167DE4B9|nr:ImmA/IrrE family metallo-endopeptidase [Streptomyces umbrinus]MCR3732014.1 Zn-dependent peptidase ImmA (M78 family) [Streptomyces umbrinus]GHH57964.1 XRE family transcriptional regulator [Streptomyces umbrinus]
MAIGELQAQPGMLVLARESRGLTQTEVATAMTKASPGGSTPVSQGYVSRAEAGRLVVSDERLELYATALGYPPELLCLDPQVNGIGVGLVHHRKKASLSASALRRVHAHLALARLQLDGLTSAAALPEVSRRFFRVPLNDLITPKDAARRVRKAWGMVPGPVSDMVGVLENAGALIVTADLDSDLLDAVSQWDEDGQPLLLANTRAPGDRRRFSIAHELGHLVMHPEPGAGSTQEKQADAFAAEFLMPASDIREAFSGGVNLARLADLKRIWGTSMGALLRRAQSLNAISEWQYRNLVIEMSALGYRTAEPVEVPPERPQRIPALVRTLLADHQMPLEDAAACAHLLPEDFQRLFIDDVDSSSFSDIRR